MLKSQVVVCRNKTQAKDQFIRKNSTKEEIEQMNTDITIAR